MKAIVIHGAGDLRVEDCDVTPVGPNQVRIRLAIGGICGSDLHYFNHGGFGDVKLKEPMILGHEVAGHITELGTNVDHLSIGQLVAISPSRPCGICRYCSEGKQNHCLNMRFYGSAMPFPHIQGAFRETLVADANQCATADGLTPSEAAAAEPLAVCLHAVRRAGSLVGKRVIVTGCGPIGIFCILSARCAGAEQIVATDLEAFPLEMAKRAGATEVINIKTDPSGLAPLSSEKGTFNTLFECSGSPSALAAGIEALRPGGQIMQLGLGGDMIVPVQKLTAKELSLIGSFRFHEEFFTGVELMKQGALDVKPFITQTFELRDAMDAFRTAGDRSSAIKTQIAFS
ncbi:MAG: L-idonate 5-dehydrogenase [Planctomycetales bacterium]|nr:L-idonate 5-dehydrogenase [Planctomycetales bacterium]MCC0025153.1 L-idonate 5-dehydrogenase [Hyphomicrobiaceae bacterium]